MNGVELKDERPHNPMQANEMIGERWCVDAGGQTRCAIEGGAAVRGVAARR